MNNRADGGAPKEIPGCGGATLVLIAVVLLIGWGLLGLL